MQNYRERRRVVMPSSLSPNSVSAAPWAAFNLKNRSEIRSQELLRAVASIDTTHEPAARTALLGWLNEEYARRQGGHLLGLFSRCYLGPPFVDHQLSLAGDVLEHYTAQDQVPPGFAAARPLVRSDAYLFIEVYSDGQIVPVRPDGTPTL